MTGRFILSCIGAVILLSGCTAHYTAQLTHKSLQVLSLKEKHQVERAADWRLHTRTAIFLTAPAMFNQYQVDYYLPSTRASMHRAFVNALSRAFPDIAISDSVWRVEQALTLARKAQAQILVMPSLQLLVNDQNTLTGYEAKQIDNPDLIYPLDTSVIRVSIYDVQSGSLIDVVNIDSRGKLYKPKNYSLATFIGRAAMKFTHILSGRKLAPFG